MKSIKYPVITRMKATIFDIKNISDGISSSRYGRKIDIRELEVTAIDIPEMRQRKDEEYKIMKKSFTTSMRALIFM